MLYLIVLVAAAASFLPHVPGFSPLFGALLFGGALLKRRDSIWFPVALLGASDILLTTLVYHRPLSWLDARVYAWTLAGFAVVALCGWWLRSRRSSGRFLAAAFAGPTAFFLISNFGVWFAGPLNPTFYPKTLAGLGACYLAGLPFYGPALAATVLFGGVLFGGYAWFQRRASRERRDPAPTG